LTDCDASVTAPYGYRIGGLAVASDIPLAGAIPHTIGDGRAPDIAVRLAPVPDTLAHATDRGPNWELAGGRFLLRVPKLARYLVTAGRTIDVELSPGAAAEDASLFVLGSAFGVLLHQRGDLVLHGSAVARDGTCIAICGRSGAGKSSLAAALGRAGCEFVADDLCVVRLDEARGPVVSPDGRQLKLWRESMDALDLAARQGNAVRSGLDKYFIEPPRIAVGAPRLVAIYVLRERHASGSEGIEALSQPDAMRTLDRQAYRPALRARLVPKAAALAMSGTMLRHARVYALTRRRGFEHVPETVASLLAHWDRITS
jgi:hypothetical protein